MIYDRGGVVMATGRIGVLRVLRQQLLHPGEVLHSKVRGNVSLATTREKQPARIHARLDAFLTPVRWTWSGWPKYLQDGPSGTVSIPSGLIDATHYGIGGGELVSALQFFWHAPVHIYNQYYRWPEDDPLDTRGTAGRQLFSPTTPALVNLPTSWTRLQKNDGPETCLLYTSPSPRDRQKSRMPSSA